MSLVGINEVVNYLPSYYFCSSLVKLSIMDSEDFVETVLAAGQLRKRVDLVDLLFSRFWLLLITVPNKVSSSILNSSALACTFLYNFRRLYLSCSMVSAKNAMITETSIATTKGSSNLQHWIITLMTCISKYCIGTPYLSAMIVIGLMIESPMTTTVSITSEIAIAM